MRTQMAGVLTVLALGLMLSPGAAHAQEQAPAQEQKVTIQVDVVLASDKGDTMDPPELAQMQEKFRKQSFRFTSFKRLSLESVELVKGKPTELRLPNGTNATLKLVSVQQSGVTVRMEIPRLSAVDVNLGNQGGVYQRAGKHVGGELILALSAPAR